ncbi:Pentatricopeptide repeat-containing protein [Acorus gramineus]|uniref:Pentatricopeptide repeat-containing protein n=1 Tax=Acorus gramineus TaxID=55184 RepID=A0AAV9B7K7_ACOGR|nr:Pentatricopeptide repeat-containing protein [Acorus gramineus]
MATVAATASAVLPHPRPQNNEQNLSLNKPTQIALPSDHSLAPLIKTYSRSPSPSTALQLHAHSLKRGLSSDVFVQTSLLSFYASHNHFSLARHLFHRMPSKNVVSFTAMIDASLRIGRPDDALSLFRDMQLSGITPDGFALVGALSACSMTGALNLGRWIHAYVRRNGVDLTEFVGTALVDMYCKCGCVRDAVSVFDSMPIRTVRSWNAMLHGLAVNGRGAEAARLFDAMESDGRHRPTGVTFLSLLCGCAHGGLVEEGRRYFDRMRSEYGIVPTVKHYGCMADLLGRAGLLDEAFDMVSKMPIPPNSVVWGALLSACKARDDVVMAERVMERLARMACTDTSHHVIMSQIYGRCGWMEKSAEARLRVGRKPTGTAWVEVGCEVHEFVVGDASHPMWGEIEHMLGDMEAKAEMEEGFEDPPHSEKVAIAFGLLRVSSPAPIRISKNLRICKHCHCFMKRVSLVYEREIVVRDRNRFHLFYRGSCTCKDYW